MTSPEPVPSDRPAAASGGFPRLAQRIRRRTTDLAAISILAIAALMVGGRLSEWWSTKPEDLVPSAEIGAQEGGGPGLWGDAPVTLEFGESPLAVRRQTMTGDRDKVFGILTDWCRRTLALSPPPSAPPTAGELKLLAMLAKTEPVSERGGERISILPAPLRMIVGVRDVPTAADAETSQHTSAPAEKGNQEKTEAASRPARVVCWGFAFPVEEKLWTVFLASPGRAGGAGPTPPDIPLPPGSHKHLALRGDLGDGLLGFSGSGDPADWRRVFDAWFVPQGWTVVRPWSESGGTWSARFGSPKSAEGEGWNGTVDVQIAPGDAGKLNGLFNLMPRR